MKILFLTDNFPPEFNAPASRTYEHCKEWVRKGAEVTVITCFPNFPTGRVYKGYKNNGKQTEFIEGIKVIRVWTFIAPNAGSFKRTIDFISFALTSFLCGLFVKCNLIVATSPQFFTAVSGCALSIFKNKPWVMEVRDLWPESIKAVEALKSGWMISLLEKVEISLYKHASKIIVVTDSFQQNLSGRGIRNEKIYVIKNGVDLSIFQPMDKNFMLLEQLKINNKFIVGYIGTHGLAHSLDFIIKCLSKIKDSSYHFIFIGDGAEKNNIMRSAEALGLTNVTFLDPVKKSEIKSYLSIIDVALVPLRRSPTFESVIPSKIFESVAMNIPILLGVNGESRSMIEFYNVGLYFEPENEIDFLEKLGSIRKLLEVNKSFFDAGCKNLAHDFDRKNLAQKMLSILST